jgi:hypothetical protein
MDAGNISRITDPFITSRTTRKVGLGIPFLKAAAEACEGTFDPFNQHQVWAQPSGRFSNTATLTACRWVILSSTLQTLIIGTPEVQLDFEYQVDETLYF